MSIEILLWALSMQFTLAMMSSDGNLSQKKKKKSTTARKFLLLGLFCNTLGDSSDSDDESVKLIDNKITTGQKTSDKTEKPGNEQTTSLSDSEIVEPQRVHSNPVTSTEDSIKTHLEKDIIKTTVTPGTYTKFLTKTESDNGAQMNLIESEPHNERNSSTKPGKNSWQTFKNSFENFRRGSCDQNKTNSNKKDKREITGSMPGSSPCPSADTTSIKTDVVPDGTIGGRPIEVFFFYQINLFLKKNPPKSHTSL